VVAGVFAVAVGVDQSGYLDAIFANDCLRLKSGLTTQVQLISKAAVSSPVE